MDDGKSSEVQLFATCLGDLFFPEAVADARRLLEDAGYRVLFPRGQVCCGQPAFNAGHRRAARRVARTFTRAFARDLPVVVPSGSCTAMLSRHLPVLLGVEPYRVFELSAFLAAERVRVPRVNDSLTVSYHDSCHLSRELGVREAPRLLLEQTGAVVRPLPRPDLCCGFGGTFSVRQPEVSVAMADEKLAGVEGSALVMADPGCLLHLRARAARAGGPAVVHLATALVRGVRETA
jgi:L-lactate dehydrogenase complex protein LldE